MNTASPTAAPGARTAPTPDATTRALRWPRPRRLSLRLRISLILTAFAALLILAGGALWIAEARNAIAEEVTSAHRVAVQWLTVSARAASDNDPAWSEPRLVAYLQAAGRLRANQVELRDARGALLYRSPGSPYKAGRDAPPLFVAWMSPDLPTRSLPAGHLDIVIQPDASRAVLDLWDDLTAAAGRALLALIALFAGCWLAVDRALRPLGQVMAALGHAGDGRFDTRLPEDGPRELARLAEAFNRMTLRLDQAVADNARLHHEQALGHVLHQRLEAERTVIARELHDELGQSITAVAALAGAILQRSDGQPTVQQSARTIRDVAAHMQDDVRALLTRLRPQRPAEETLDDALRSVLGAWQKRHPDIRLVTELFAGPAPLGDELTLVALRIVQESCTNIVRHAQASQAYVRVLRQAGRLVVEVGDNGRGLQPASGQSGYGLTGMRERVAAVRGELHISSPPGGGTRIRAVLPLPDSAPHDA